MPKISPFLWFDHQAEEAAALYTSIFPNSKVTEVQRYPEGAPGPAGEVMVVRFQLDGKEFTALNGGPHFTFNESVSFVVDCKDQEEVDHYWDSLIADGGEPSQCGWLKDRYGLSWQIVPTVLEELLSDPDPQRSGRAMQAMLKMSKLDIAELRAAADNA
jgi:predicted 3-demethylubiquinone-9 3-methyltransferase (glyoxalase superfamily)